MKSINERIQLVVDQYYKGNVSAFCRDFRVSQSTMKDILGGKMYKPSNETSTKILSGVSLKINSEWLFKGEGEMLKDESVDGSRVEEPLRKYKHNCPECLANIREIEFLRNDREDLKKEITQLRARNIELEKENTELHLRCLLDARRESTA